MEKTYFKQKLLVKKKGVSNQIFNQLLAVGGVPTVAELKFVA